VYNGERENEKGVHFFGGRSWLIATADFSRYVLEKIIMKWINGRYFIDDDNNAVNLGAVHNLLRRSHWAQDRSVEIIKKSINNSLCFSLFIDNKQIGFARVLTDFATYGVILDMIIDEAHRDKGLGKWLMEIITTHDSIRNIRQVLWTSTAENLYRQFGFETTNDKPILMVKPSFSPSKKDKKT
jgi:N-acetylglutamate synthase-like GNAT family acetyltransferase